MGSAEYILEVYEPGSADTVWNVFHSASPFMTISAGDILNPGLWEGSNSPMKVLRVVSVEHTVWEIEGQVKHKVMIYTEDVEGTPELRLGASR
jgi:hypothetical protein